MPISPKRTRTPSGVGGGAGVGTAAPTPTLALALFVGAGTAHGPAGLTTGAALPRGMNLTWPALVAAGLLEVAWATSMKASDGFRRPGLAVLTVALMLASFALLGYAMRSLPLGTAYAVWTGIGAVGAAAVGILVLGEPRTVLRLACIGAIVAGIVGLKLAS